MKYNLRRPSRVAVLIQRNLSQVIFKKLRDPRLPKFLTISFVRISIDLSYARIYFTFFDDFFYNKEHFIEQILNHASGYIRTVLSKSIKNFYIPQLCFIYDRTIENNRKLIKLINITNNTHNQIK